MVTPARKRTAVAHLRKAFEMSERRACKAIGCCRMTMRYQTTRADDASLRQRMRAIAQERRRFGYRRLHVMLKREGYLINYEQRKPQKFFAAPLKPKPVFLIFLSPPYGGVRVCD